MPDTHKLLNNVLTWLNERQEAIKGEALSEIKEGRWEAFEECIVYVRNLTRLFEE